jgi:HEPN/RES N-terminal domain 1/RES domain
MGLAKERMFQEAVQGWSFTDQHVCTACVDDYALKAAVSAADEDAATCDFCGSTPAAELNVLLEAFVNGLRTEYGDADDEGVGWDGREGGYQWHRTWDTYELVEEFGDVLVGEGLLDAVQEAMDNRIWVEAHFIQPRRDEALSASWERFCEAVQYKTRYVFWLRQEDDEQGLGAGDIPASRILEEIGHLIDTLDLLRELPAGHRLWRARPHELPAAIWNASDLGTAPRERASQANRMSPAGIPMFYGAENPATAIQEVAIRADGKQRWVTVGAFETSQPCVVGDFTNLPSVPSMFDPGRGRQRRPLLFLHEFVAQLSKPARAKEYEQIDYVPTQVVTEYLLRIFAKGQLIVGLLYPSRLTGEPCVVLDVPHNRCVEQEPGWEVAEDGRLRLGFVRRSIQTGRQ